MNTQTIKNIVSSNKLAFLVALVGDVVIATLLLVIFFLLFTK